MLKKKHRKRPEQPKHKRKKKPIRGLPADLKRKVKKIKYLREIFDFKYPMDSLEKEEEFSLAGKVNVPNTGPGTAPNTGPGTMPG